MTACRTQWLRCIDCQSKQFIVSQQLVRLSLLVHGDVQVLGCSVNIFVSSATQVDDYFAPRWQSGAQILHAKARILQPAWQD